MLTAEVFAIQVSGLEFLLHERLGFLLRLLDGRKLLVLNLIDPANGRCEVSMVQASAYVCLGV